VVTEVVIVTSPNDGAGAKAAEAATIVDDGGARARAMEAAIKSVAAEASTSKATAAVEATATAAMTTSTAPSATTTCQRHGRRGQASRCNSQRDHCLSQHLISIQELAPSTTSQVQQKAEASLNATEVQVGSQAAVEVSMREIPAYLRLQTGEGFRSSSAWAQAL
jgi:hypothetical protein